MISVHLRLFGLESRKGGFSCFEWMIREDSKLRELWVQIQASLLHCHYDEKSLTVLINGKHFHQLAGWETILSKDDTIVFMVLAVGG
jgi:hypothetical protein